MEAFRTEEPMILSTANRIEGRTPVKYSGVVSGGSMLDVDCVTIGANSRMLMVSAGGTAVVIE